MTGWWRRNAVALGALVVLTPVTFGAITWDGWQDHNLFTNTIPIDVADGDSMELIDTTWGPVRASEITDTSGFDMPTDARIIAAAITVDPHGDAPSCSAPTLVQQSTGIRFPESRFQLGLLSSSEEPTSCVTDGENRVASYEMIVPFIVPADAEGPFWVEIASVDAIPSVIRFSIDP
ncbi:hypothetical protein [Microbacterium sp. A93]|uniref:hypothetical protein n=1 Tax=unclassified Microbacterium TaxID=2609290 RepID=UPI003F435FFF